jgi:DNA repair protein RadC
VSGADAVDGVEVPAVKPDGSLAAVPPAVRAGSSDGHRRRLLERYRLSGIDALHPHELLELLLTYSIGRKDTKPVAKRLLDRFRSVGAVCNAPAEELQEVAGIGERSATLFTLVRDLLSVVLRERYQNLDIMSSREDVEAYLRVTFGHRRDEYLAALFLDAKNHVRHTEIIAEGTVNQCAVFPRVIFEKALKCGAAGIIMAHNHPAGTPNPSEQDWQITTRIHTAGTLLDLPLVDHILICSERTVSLRELPRWPRGERGRT